MRMYFVGIAALLMFAVPLKSQFSSVDRAACEQYGKLLVDAINSRDSLERLEIIRKVFSAATIQRIGIDRLFHQVAQIGVNFNPMQFHHAEISEFQKLTGMTYVIHIFGKKQGAKMWSDIQAYLEPAPPYGLQQIMFIAEVTEPINLPNGSIDQTATLQWLDNYAEKLQSAYDLSGSYQIVKGKSAIFEKRFGFADLQRKKPITSSTLFNLASGGKMFTAVATAQLAEQGKLRFDDPITRYVKGFKNESAAANITIHHLLSHTSGINEYWSGQNNSEVYSAVNIRDHLKIVLRSDFSFPPGTQYQYCNANYILLGAVIEQISGKSFYDYVQQNIFDKAGMHSSGYYNHGDAKVAIPFARGTTDTTWIEAPYGIRGSSAGGAYSCGEDMVKFINAFRHGKLVSPAMVSTMITPKNSGLNGTEEYGYGFIISRGGGEYAYGHGGTAGGVNFELRYFPRQDVTTILFCNQNNGAYDDLKKNIMKLVSGQR